MKCLKVLVFLGLLSVVDSVCRLVMLVFSGGWVVDSRLVVLVVRVLMLVSDLLIVLWLFDSLFMKCWSCMMVWCGLWGLFGWG